MRLKGGGHNGEHHASRQLSNSTWNLIKKLGDKRTDDNFGSCVAVSGDLVVVGADRDSDNDNGFLSGAAYIFNATTGAELRKLVASDGAAYNKFGRSVAVSGDLVVVGAPRYNEKRGAAYIFNATTGAELHKLVASDGAAYDFFGLSVAVSGDIVVVGTDPRTRIDNFIYQYSFNGSAYVFSATTGDELHKLVPTDNARDDYFGRNVAVSGDIVVVGALGKFDYYYYDNFESEEKIGFAYIFNATTGAELHKLVASDGADGAYGSYGDEFGWSVAASGDLVVVGAYFGKGNSSTHSGSAYIFNATTGAELYKPWLLLEHILAFLIVMVAVIICTTDPHTFLTPQQEPSYRSWWYLMHVATARLATLSLYRATLLSWDHACP